MTNLNYPTKWLSLGEDHLLICPDTGNWLFLDNTNKEILLFYQSSMSIESTLSAFPNVDRMSILDLILAYRDHLLTKQNTESTECPDCMRGIYPKHAVLNLTEACNLKCTYCYVNAGSGQKEMMKTETAIRILEDYRNMNQDKPFTLLMHGGEPLLNFRLIKELTLYAEKYRNQVNISIQTNASLITDEIAEFFSKYRIRVGVSIDGPEIFHNQTRPLQNGKGSFTYVMRGINILKKHDVPFGTITVMTKNIATHIDDVLDFFIANDINAFSFSPFQKIGRGKDDVDSYVDGKLIFEAYKRIVTRIIEHNLTRDLSNRLEERYLKNMIRSIFANVQTFMCMRAPCGAGRATLGFGVNGDFYICDDFINDQDFLVGRLSEGSVKDQLLTSVAVLKTESRRMKNLVRCKDCDWRSLCGGICYSSDYYSGARGVEETAMCRFNKLMIPYLIQQYTENPALPGLLDHELSDSTQRKLLICLDQKNGTEEVIDSSFLDTLLKFHNIKTADTVYLYGKSLSNTELLTCFAETVQNHNASCCIILTQEQYKTYRNYLKPLTSSRFIVLTQIQFMCREDNLSDLSSFAENRNIYFLLDTQNIVHSDLIYFRRLSDKIQKDSLESMIKVNTSSARMLAEQSILFATIPDEDTGEFLLIDNSNLTGRITDSFLTPILEK